MSFIAQELSAWFGAPVELYKFYTSTQSWTMTSSAFEQTYMSQVYTPVSMERTQIDHTKDFGKATLEVRMPRDHILPAQYIVSPPDGQLMLIIYRFHLTDTEYKPYWIGRVMAVEFQGPVAVIKCENSTTSLRSRGHRATYSSTCRHSLYRTGCNVNDQNFKVSTTLISVNGPVLESPDFASKPDGWFAGGRIYALIGGIEYRRMIVDHASTRITLLTGIMNMPGNADIDAFAGCNHDLGSCYDKFGNWLNYGGFPWKPTKNPFQGDPIL